VLETGSHEHSLRVPAADLLLIAEAEVADICVDTRSPGVDIAAPGALPH
jgi:hypothetical protein